jgi:subtilisin family serine protease
MSTCGRDVAALVGTIVALLAIPQLAVAETRPSSSSGVVEDSYIVAYRDAVARPAAATASRERRLGFEADYTYSSALRGFAARLTPDQLELVRDDPDVAFVAANRWAAASAAVPLASGEPLPPTGVRRIRAATRTTVREASSSNVAIIDTGIRLKHPDLNAAPGIDCIDPGTPPSDGHGHGTHVAGTVGALNNGSGVVGVAPGTKVYAVRVLDDSGYGSFAEIICGIDWVTANAAANNIEVVNMSLGGLLGGAQSPCPGTSDALHLAICNATDAGTNVTFVVAAGNSAWDFDFAPNPDVPAAYKEVLTVTAASDSDGKPGALGPQPSCRSDSFDDREAPFSNFAATAAGSNHTIAAPGVCIKSTWLAGGYNTISGTSMASPHMAGVAALCHGEVGSADGPCKARTPKQNINYLRAVASNYNTNNPSYGFLHDPLHTPLSGKYFGFLTRAPNPIP